MDSWSVMDYGSYNAEGFVPCAYTAFERYSLGWIPMYTLDEPATVTMATTEKERKGYRIFTSEADTASFYMLETIRKEGWNRYAPANGMLISEVTYDRSAWKDNTVNAEANHRHCIVPANNEHNYWTADKHLFGNASHEFTLNSIPASVTQFGVAMDKPITDIEYDATTGTTTFKICGGEPEIPEGPDNTTGSIEEVATDNEQQTTDIYDLMGRRVENPSKGIYIVNGKKTVIK
jgi:hypothetical protein